MVALFVHGVPDDRHLWDEVRGYLPGVPSLAVDLPGFHAPVPPGFDASKEAYADWLLDTVVELGEPVDLVGHGWGAILALRLISVRPGTVRTLAVGGATLDAPRSELTRTWQTPGAGEQLMSDVTRGEYVAILMEAGVPRAAAERSVFDDPLAKQCILRMYRSTRGLKTDWDPALRPLRVPALVLWGADDPFTAPEVGARMARRIGARMRVFAHCGHWYPYQRPAEMAAELRRLWAG